MKKVQLNKITGNDGKNVYTVVADGKIIYSSAPTHRNYVAMIVSKNEAHYRFGSLLLIGKNDSSDDYRNHTYPYLAVLPSVSKIVAVPPRQPIFRYELARGNKLVYVWGVNDSEAKTKACKKFKSHYGLFTRPIQLTVVKRTEVEVLITGV